MIWAEGERGQGAARRLYERFERVLPLALERLQQYERENGGLSQDVSPLLARSGGDRAAPGR